MNSVPMAPLYALQVMGGFEKRRRLKLGSRQRGARAQLLSYRVWKEAVPKQEGMSDTRRNTGVMVTWVFPD